MYLEELVKSHRNVAVNQIPLDLMEQIIDQYNHLFNHRRNQIAGMKVTASATGRHYFSLRFFNGVVDGYKFDMHYPDRTTTYAIDANVLWDELGDTISDYSFLEVAELL